MTGASGFLGSAVVEALAAAGHRVRAGVRRWPDQGVWPDGVRPVQCDVEHGDGLATACEGVDAVIHLAAAMGDSASAQQAVAVDGTARLIEAMVGRCSRLLLASSFAVYDWSRVGATLDEQGALLDDQALHGQDAYTCAKLRQEQLARTLCAQHGIGLTVLRPALIWSGQRRDLSCVGPGNRWLRVVVAPRRSLRLTHVDSCASAFVAALDSRASGQTLNIDDATGITAWDYAGASGARLRVPIPLSLACAVAALAGALLKPLVGADRLPGLLVPQRLQARFHRARAGHAALQRLGWQPPAIASRFH
ncbi:MAG: NAD(P)-dependent oxidoreductase [Duganella sp.]